MSALEVNTIPKHHEASGGEYGGLRCRSRSCSHVSGDEFFYESSDTPRQISGSPSSFISPDHGYGLKHYPRPAGNDSSLGKISYDSGLGNSAGEFRPSTIMSKLVENASTLISDDIKNNISDLRKKWRKQNAALYSSSPARNKYVSGIRAHDVLPIAVMIITMGTAFFTFIVMLTALNSSNSYQSPKYASIKYGHGAQLEKLDKVFPILDEDGNPLGGKRAAIQFAYNMRYQKELPEVDPRVGMDEVVKEIKPEVKADESNIQAVLTDQEIIDRLTFKVANDVMVKMEKMQQEEESAAQKKLMLEKMNQFGHFGTSRVEPLDLEVQGKVGKESVETMEDLEQAEVEVVAEKQDQRDDEVEPTKDGKVEPTKEEDKVKPSKELKKVKKMKKRDLISKKDDPFRINDAEAVMTKAEEDPFRFM